MRSSLAVLDASVVTEALVAPGRVGAIAATLRDRRLVAPAHLDAEVLNALFGLARAGRISPDRLRGSVRLLRRFPARRVALARLLEHASALRHNLSSYDALYVALARRLACPMITSDRRLAGAPRLGIELVLVG